MQETKSNNDAARDAGQISRYKDGHGNLVTVIPCVYFGDDGFGRRKNIHLVVDQDGNIRNAESPYYEIVTARPTDKLMGWGIDAQEFVQLVEDEQQLGGATVSKEHWQKVVDMTSRS